MPDKIQEIKLKNPQGEMLDLISDNISYVGFVIMFAIAIFSIARKTKKNKKAISTLEKNIRENLNEPLTLHPEIDESLCAGCGACVKACPEGEILQLINHKAALVYPTKCVGHGACEQACPFDAIDLVFGTKTRGMDIPRISPDYETNIAGLYIAGELGGMGLIRNAIKQGRLAAMHAVLKSKTIKVIADYDIFVIGAGPAGFSSALTALEQKLKYKLIDQNTFGGTIFNFPRKKIVTSHPIDIPIFGTKKFKSNIVSKEEMLEVFNKIKTENKLKISERESFKNLKVLENGLFEIETDKGIYSTKKVILAMGVRGSPRRLGLQNEDMPKVTYNLIDPDEYQNVSVAVVGGGNAGLEAAQYLSKKHLKNKVYLIVRGGPEEAFSRANEQNQKIIFDLEREKTITILYDSSIKAIETEYIIVKKGEEEIKVKNNFIFIFAGAEVPFKFLMSLGIKIDKAHGEKRRSG